MKLKLIGLVVLVVTMAALFFSFIAAAENQQAAVEERADIDKEALEILQKATDYMASLKQFLLKGYKTTDVVEESGQKLQFSSSFEVSLKRPDRIFNSRMDDDGINLLPCWAAVIIGGGKALEFNHLQAPRVVYGCFGVL